VTPVWEMGGGKVAVELRNVDKRYGDLSVLRGVDLRIEAGELVAVVGPSGSGKTTLLQIMGTLDRATSGTVHIGGEEVTGMSDRWLSGIRAHRLGFVFQQFFLNPTLSAVDNVATGLLYTGTAARLRRTRAAEALRRVGLGHRLHHRPGELSGGECQRAAIARAIVGGPELILADEPTGNLDSRSGADVIEVLHELNAAGATVVVITHDREVAATMPRLIGIRDGEIAGDRRSE
jgi:putative ABC transport system ATP-binding protein